MQIQFAEQLSEMKTPSCCNCMKKKSQQLALPETGYMPCARSFADCHFLGTLQTSCLPRAGRKAHNIISTLGKSDLCRVEETRHSAKHLFAEWHTYSTRQQSACARHVRRPSGGRCGRQLFASVRQGHSTKMALSSVSPNALGKHGYLPNVFRSTRQILKKKTFSYAPKFFALFLYYMKYYILKLDISR